jgi:endonuclease G, mitochondrial
VVLREGEDDLQRITERTPVLAVDMPNQQGIRDDDWRAYLTSVDQIEGRTGYDLLSNIPPVVQQRIEAVVAAP